MLRKPWYFESSSLSRGMWHQNFNSGSWGLNSVWPVGKVAGGKSSPFSFNFNVSVQKCNLPRQLGLLITCKDIKQFSVWCPFQRQQPYTLVWWGEFVCQYLITESCITKKCCF